MFLNACFFGNGGPLSILRSILGPNLTHRHSTGEMLEMKTRNRMLVFRTHKREHHSVLLLIQVVRLWLPLRGVARVPKRLGPRNE